MSTAKIIELVGSSTTSWEDAARNAVAEAAETLKGLHGVEVTSWTGTLEGSKIVTYKATVKIAFQVIDNR